MKTIFMPAQYYYRQPGGHSLFRRVPLMLAQQFGLQLSVGEIYDSWRYRFKDCDRIANLVMRTRKPHYHIQPTGGLLRIIP
jgi:hypothetical protein